MREPSPGRKTEMEIKNKTAQCAAQMNNNDEISKRIKSVKKINKSSINASKIGVYLA